jgi:hypothetical protein
LDEYYKKHQEYPPFLRVLGERDNPLPALLERYTIQDEWAASSTTSRTTATRRAGGHACGLGE